MSTGESLPLDNAWHSCMQSRTLILGFILEAKIGKDAMIVEARRVRAVLLSITILTPSDHGNRGCGLRVWEGEWLMLWEEVNPLPQSGNATQCAKLLCC